MHPRRAGGPLLRKISGGSVVSEGTTTAHKSVRTESSSFGPVDFLKSPESNKCAHGQYDCAVILSQNGGTHSRELTSLAKKIWVFLLSKQIKITAEYLPGILNV